MIVMIHDKGTNKFYITVAGLTMINGMENGNVDGLIFTKKLLKQLKAIDLKEPLPIVRIQRLYQIDTNEIHLDHQDGDAASDPEPWQPPRS